MTPAERDGHGSRLSFPISGHPFFLACYSGLEPAKKTYLGQTRAAFEKDPVGGIESYIAPPNRSRALIP